MKNIGLLFIGFLFFLLLEGCCKCDSDRDQCDIVSDVQGIDWLFPQVVEHESYGDSVVVQIMEMPLYKEKGYLYKFIEKEEIRFPFQEYYYTCNGTLICYNLGGISGSDCGVGFNDLKLGAVIYSSN